MEERKPKVNIHQHITSHLRRYSKLLVIIAIAISGLAVSGTAQAATNAPAHASAAAARTAPATLGLSVSSATALPKAPLIVYVSIIYYNGRSYDYPCAEGHTYHGGLPAEVQYVNNNCAVRVWLHQNNNNSGHSLCVSPHTLVATNSRITWVNLYVSNNNSNC
jgi:hypothetical protein